MTQRRVSPHIVHIPGLLEGARLRAEQGQRLGPVFPRTQHVDFGGRQQPWQRLLHGP
jgi:hypothetical protein